MPPPRNEWEKVGHYLMWFALEIKQRKKILLPSVSRQPSASIESEVDLWFLNVAKTLKLSVYPSDELAPWILVRLTCAKALADSYGDKNETSPRGLSMADLIRRMTVDQWHAQLKDTWMKQGPSFGDS